MNRRGLRQYSPEVSRLLRRIDAALAAIESADLWPSSAEALRFRARVGTIHYSSLTGEWTTA